MDYKRGDVIGRRYEVCKTLGKGGFGVVYLAQSRDRGLVALKTFREEYLADAATRDMFRREARAWIDVGSHPYIVGAQAVEEWDGRPYIVLEYVPPDSQAINTLEEALARRRPKLTESLRWALQFCHGMEYAQSRGIRCHRDIKPANILLSQGRTAKISDFGLAGALAGSRAAPALSLSFAGSCVGLSCNSAEQGGFGTPPYMPPEQFESSAACDARSDVYAFGVVLFQLACGGKLPFLARFPRNNSAEEVSRFWNEMKALHKQAPVPEMTSPLAPLVRRCLEKDPAKRYPSFASLRPELEAVLAELGGVGVALPPAHKSNVFALNDKGASLRSLGRLDEALQCLEEAIRLDAGMTHALHNKGLVLADLGRYEEAITCYDREIAQHPLATAPVWIDKGVALQKLERRQEALLCLDKALGIDPTNSHAWFCKGDVLLVQERAEEALAAVGKGLELSPLSPFGLKAKAEALLRLKNPQEALACLDKAAAVDPLDAGAWRLKSSALDQLGQTDEAQAALQRSAALAGGEAGKAEAARPTAPKRKKYVLKCPHCGKEQAEGNTECSACGIVFEKFIRQGEARRIAAAGQGAPSSGSGWLSSPMILAALATVCFFIAWRPLAQSLSFLDDLNLGFWDIGVIFTQDSAAANVFMVLVPFVFFALFVRFPVLREAPLFMLGEVLLSLARCARVAPDQSSYEGAVSMGDAVLASGLGLGNHLPVFIALCAFLGCAALAAGLAGLLWEYQQASFTS